MPGIGSISAAGRVRAVAFGPRKMLSVASVAGQKITNRTPCLLRRRRFLVRLSRKPEPLYESYKSDFDRPHVLSSTDGGHAKLPVGGR
jgi:hypothetical protein